MAIFRNAKLTCFSWIRPLTKAKEMTEHSIGLWGEKKKSSIFPKSTILRFPNYHPGGASPKSIVANQVSNLQFVHSQSMVPTMQLGVYAFGEHTPEQLGKKKMQHTKGQAIP